MRLLPIASDGWRFILPLSITGLILTAIGRSWSYGLGGLCLLAALFCIFFFRDFDRNTVLDDALIYSPGDGRILEAGVLDEGPYKEWKIIRIFLSVFDVHVQRSPVNGRVSQIEYQKGLFLDARDPQAHIQNEQMTLTLESDRGVVVVKQIAGLIARRIVWWTQQGSHLRQGERYGLIRFGSQVDVLLPSSAVISVRVGDRVVSGETVVARW